VELGFLREDYRLRATENKMVVGIFRSKKQILKSQ
jgi:hypothetical protein